MGPPPQAQRESQREQWTVPWLWPEEDTYLRPPRSRIPQVPRGQPMGPPPPRWGPPYPPGRSRVCLPVKKRGFAAGGGGGGGEGEGSGDDDDGDMQPPDPFEWTG